MANFFDNPWLNVFAYIFVAVQIVTQNVFQALDEDFKIFNLLYSRDAVVVWNARIMGFLTILLLSLKLARDYTEYSYDKEMDMNKILLLISLILKPRLMINIYTAYQLTDRGVVFAKTKTNVIEYANPRFQKWIGYSQAELRQRPFTDFVSPDDFDKTISEADRMYRNNDATLDFTNRYVKKGGGIVKLRWRGVVVGGWFNMTVEKIEG